MSVQSHHHHPGGSNSSASANSIQVEGQPHNPVESSPYLPEALANLTFSQKELTQAQADAIQSLAQDAAACSDHAIEVLLNLSLGDNAAGAYATAALLDICRDPDSPPAARASVEQMTLDLLLRGIGYSESKAKSSTVLNAFPGSLLYLVGRQAPGHQDLVVQMLRGRVDPDNMFLIDESPKESLSAQRFITQAELVKATGAQYGNHHDKLPVFAQAALRPGPASDTERQKAFDRTLNDVMTEARQAGEPRAVFVDTGSHWVSMVVVPDPDRRRFEAIVFNSRTSAPTDPDETLLVAALERSDSWKGSWPMHYVSGALQSHALDACGAFAVKSVELLRQFRSTAEGAATDAAGLASHLVGFARKWEQLTPDVQRQLVTAQRAHILGQLQARAVMVAPPQPA